MKTEEWERGNGKQRCGGAEVRRSRGVEEVLF